jgi:hypothetical protein
MDTEANKSNSRFSVRSGFIIILILLVSLVAIALSIPIVTRSGPHRHDQTEAVHNARQIGLTLIEFDNKYGTYPNEASAALVTKSHPAHGQSLTGRSSNSAFRQLIADEVTQIEHFYAKIKGSRKPDGIITPGEALKKSEVGFSYIYDLSSKDDPATPIILTPLIPGTNRFDPKPFDGKAIILHIDNSVRAYTISEDGHIYDDKGIDLLSAKHPIWKGKAPDIRYPDL